MTIHSLVREDSSRSNKREKGKVIEKVFQKEFIGVSLRAQ
jgi:hypothetical protein